MAAPQMMRRTLAILVLLFLTVYGWAGSARVPMLASAVQTATAQGGSVAVAGVSEMVVTVDVTAVSGTNPLLSVYLQGSRDAGTTWFDIPHQGSVVLSNTAAAGFSEPPGNRNVLTQQGTTLKAAARYSIFTDAVRVAWVITGTSPTFTFQVDMVAK